MGRLKKQTVDYFPHFVSTDSRTKFILEQSWGNDGYAFWFKLLELLGRSEGHYYDYSTTANVKYFIALMRLEDSTINEILATLVDIGNIDKELWENHKVIWCQNFVDNLQNVYSKRTISVPKKPFIETQLEHLQEEGQNKQENVKKTATKKKSVRNILTIQQNTLFERFYAVYPKKRDRATAEKAWAKIEPQPDEVMTEKIIQAVEAAKKYDSRFTESQYIPNPASWLNAKGYLNEYTQEGGNNYGEFNSEAGKFEPSRGFKE